MMYVPDWIIEMFTSVTMMAMALLGLRISRNQDHNTTYWIGIMFGALAIGFMSIMLFLMGD